jgi:hypothetical protein
MVFIYLRNVFWAKVISCVGEVNQTQLTFLSELLEPTDLINQVMPQIFGRLTHWGVFQRNHNTACCDITQPISLSLGIFTQLYYNNRFSIWDSNLFIIFLYSHVYTQHVNYLRFIQKLK